MTNIRRICEGRFTLPLAVADALPLFTPEGERRWVGPSWDPVYALPESAADDLSDGYDGFLEHWRRAILAALVDG